MNLSFNISDINMVCLLLEGPAHLVGIALLASIRTYKVTYGARAVHDNQANQCKALTSKPSIRT